MNIIGKKNIFLTISSILVLASVISIVVFGLKLGIDFTGGTLWQFKFIEKDVSKDELSNFIKTKLEVMDAIIITQPEQGFLIRSKEIDEARHQKNLELLNQDFGKIEELRFENIGPSIGAELQKKAITAFVLVLLAISLYIAFAFRKVSHPVSSWKYGIITLITLFHDAVIPIGLLAVLGRFLNIEIDISSTVAILVVIGFSVHDTIVVFDRVRENLKTKEIGKIEFSALVNQSVNQTIVRSINTSLTLILVLVALFFFGALSLKYFVLVILTGTVVGTYSSIFVASPLLVLWKTRY
jgi:preprotein translocase subunit SecF